MKKLVFNISMVQNGQKSSTANAQPTLSAKSTSGKFEITSPVSKALGIAPGENIMFLNNIDAVQNAINERSEDILNLASELGVDIDTRDGQETILRECVQWFIGKGVAKFKANGQPLMTVVRVSKEDKQKYLDAHRAELVEANRDALIAQFGELSDEELAKKLTVDMVPSPEVEDFTGSKTATTSSATGVGCQLNFTDSNIWNQLKDGLEDKTSVNRIFDVKLDEVQTAQVHDGSKYVDINVYPIEFNRDEKPMQRVGKAEESAE